MLAVLRDNFWCLMHYNSKLEVRIKQEAIALIHKKVCIEKQSYITNEIFDGI